MTLSQTQRERRAAIKAQLDALVAGAESRADKNFSPAETARFDGLLGDLRAADAAIADMDENEARAARSAQARAAAGEGGTWSVGGESSTYRPDGSSFFADLIHARRGDRNAADRLARNNSERGLESRALGNTGGAGGSGAEFAPPAWLIDEFVKMTRPARVTADLFHREPLPLGVSSISIPKITGGTAVAVQTTQNSTVAAVDMTTSALSSSVTTVAGKQVVSRQLMDQSGIPFDRVVLQDLAADYARQVGAQAILGTGLTGQLRGFLTPTTGTNVVTWTQASPTAGLFFSQLARLQGLIAASRFASPDAVVMHPRRWAWLASYMDSTGRPLVAPVAGSFNSMAQAGDQRAQGQVGSLLGMDVFVDPNIPTTQGVGTNQDVVLMFVRDDVWLWESELRAEAFEAPYAESLGLLFRCFGYLAMIPERYPASLGSIVGTGLVAPVFAS